MLRDQTSSKAKYKASQITMQAQKSLQSKWKMSPKQVQKRNGSKCKNETMQAKSTMSTQKTRKDEKFRNRETKVAD